ncbi:hypothetical protein HY379_02475 [Candidatus Saccharibacteria bacterium]|nr:hypothetical protein [Candidatus Saccharibacteria bacterium]
MTKTIAVRMAAAGAAALGLVGGFVATAAADSVSTEGPNSPISVNSRTRESINNNNRVRVSSHNRQSASTGNAVVNNNTTGGSATSGTASNDNSLDASVFIDNSGSGFASASLDSGFDLSTQGPNSPINLNTSSSLRITNNNSVSVSSSSSQTTTSGDATVNNNTTGGDATTGDATNTNSTTVTVDISN